MSQKDRIFTDTYISESGFLDQSKNLTSFAFNSKVASVFDDMVSRSIPSYGYVQNLTAEFIAQNISRHAIIYDLGCSTATTLLQIIQKLKDAELVKTLQFVGIDSSEYMIERAKQKIEALAYDANITLLTNDFSEVDFQKTDFVISLYTIQFIAPDKRLTLLKRIYESMKEKSYLILSEKVHYEDPIVHNYFTRKYYEFKKQNGYSEVEINRKREALENVLITFTEEENKSLLKQAGFNSVEIIHSDLLFKTFMACK